VPGDGQHGGANDAQLLPCDDVQPVPADGVNVKDLVGAAEVAVTLTVR